jgi:hypothetical protein
MFDYKVTSRIDNHPYQTKYFYKFHSSLFSYYSKSEVYSIQHYVMKFVDDFGRPVVFSGFLH